jgi:hypothetical protein
MTTTTYSIKDLKVRAFSGSGAGTDLPVAQMLNFEPVFSSAENIGDDVLANVETLLTHGKFSFETGAFTADALSIILGDTFLNEDQTRALAGETESEYNWFAQGGGSCGPPYFEALGYATTDDCTNGMIELPKAKVTEGMAVSFDQGKWFVSSMKGLVLPKPRVGGDDVIANLILDDTTDAYWT